MILQSCANQTVCYGALCLLSVTRSMMLFVKLKEEAINTVFFFVFFYCFRSGTEFFVSINAGPVIRANSGRLNHPAFVALPPPLR